MDKQSFRALQEKLKLLINHTKKEDLARGIDVTKPEYKQALVLLEDKILEKLGLTREEYETLKISFKKPEKKVSYNELIDTPSFPETLAPGAIKSLIDDSIKRVPAPTTTIVNKIEKETIVEKPQIIHTKEVVKEVDNSKLEPLFQDIRTIQLDLQSLIDQVGKDIQVSKQFMSGFDGEVTNKITELVQPELHKVVRSLQSQIYATNKHVDELDANDFSAFLKLDQTTPQTIINGVPYFYQGLKVNDNIQMNGNTFTGLLGIGIQSGGYITTGLGTDYWLVDSRQMQFWYNPVGGSNQVFTFDASGISNNTTRTYTVPNASGTLALTSDIRVGKITTAIDTYGILVTDETVICNKATAFTVTLPTAVVGQRFNIKNIGAGIVTVDGADSDLIDDVLTQDIEQWECVTLQCYANNKWAIL